MNNIQDKMQTEIQNNQEKNRLSLEVGSYELADAESLSHIREK